MSRLTEEFSMDMSLENATRACQSAIAARGLSGAPRPDGIEVAIPGGATSWPSKITIRLAPTSSEQTAVTLDGKIGGYGPVQKRHLRGQLDRLRTAIGDNAQGIFLRDCTMLGGYGHDIAPGTRCSVLFAADDVRLMPVSGEPLTFPYEDIESVEVGGKGLVRSGGGFIGGGFGAEGAALGIGVTSVLNSLLATSSIDTVVNIQGRDRQGWLHYDKETPQALNIRLAGVLAKIAAARRQAGSSSHVGGSVSDELARLHELHAQGVLTDDEFSAAKARLIERL